MVDLIEVWVPTNERVERDYTAAERKQRDKDIAAVETEARSAADEAAAKEAAKASALAKLEALGLTTEEAQAIAGI